MMPRRWQLLQRTLRKCQRMALRTPLMSLGRYWPLSIMTRVNNCILIGDRKR